MVEQIMFFSGGFLVASLLALILMPVVHRRAVRIAIRDLRDSVPLSVKEPLAQVDGLRAEFAVSTRRLELQVEQLKVRVAHQLSENGRLRAHLARIDLARTDLAKSSWAKSSWRTRDLRKVESGLGADTDFEHANHFEPDSGKQHRLDRRQHPYPDGRRSERAESVVHLQEALVERRQFLNRWDAEISAAFAKIAALKAETGRTGPERKDREARLRS
jgi:hypothetical protein